MYNNHTTRHTHANASPDTPQTAPTQPKPNRRP
nr:MAG TPA: hypothetical protein [Caudoviricetes sp.]